MNFEEAIKLKTGSKVYDCFGNKLLVYKVDFNLSFVDGKEQKKCFIHTIDSKLDKVKLSHENVFFDQEFLSDEEKIFVDWISNNKDFVNKNQDVLHIISHCFLQGFAEGYKYKKKQTLQELMDK
jgi:hypothetical protein